MILKDSKTIKEVQKEFNNKFPYLKIEFYKKEHAANEGSPDSIKWGSDQLLGNIRSGHNSGDLSIRKELKVSELEGNFFDQYGLSVQVFYKSGDIWLQTTTTDDWTLDQQNARAESFAKFQESK